MTRIMNASLLAQLEEAAPQVTNPSHDVHAAVVKALVAWASTHALAGKDQNSIGYWYSSLQELIPLSGMEITPNTVGRACRNMCLVMRRENTGWHVAFSEKQHEILRREFGVGVTK